MPLDPAWYAHEDLEAEGYGDEVAALIDRAARFPGTHQYTADRHRYVAFIMPGGYGVTNFGRHSRGCVLNMAMLAGYERAGNRNCEG